MLRTAPFTAILLEPLQQNAALGNHQTSLPNQRMKEFELDQWKKLRELAEGLDVARGFQFSYAFRGHGDCSWKLVPTLHRSASLELTRELPAVDKLLVLEAMLLERFRQQAPTLLPHAVFHTTNAGVDWWTVMRHYGVPTRILDWTESFYVALYFAVSTEPKKDGAVYVLHLHSLDQAVRDKYSDAGAFNSSTIEVVTKRGDAPHAIHIMRRSSGLIDRMLAPTMHGYE